MARAPAAHPKAEYTTATAPLAKANSLGHLQGESIHELLGPTCVTRKHVLAVAPLVNCLIIYIRIRLWQERLKAVLDAELYGRRPRVLAAARAP